MDFNEETVVDDSEAWKAKFRELREYRIINGDCNVPRKHKLGIWVKDMKAFYKGKKGKKLSPERIALLESIGFSWGKDVGPPPSWDNMFEELQKYQKASKFLTILASDRLVMISSDLPWLSGSLQHPRQL